ncbi:MAG: aspartate aminotransferase family protein [Flavobacteriales bacterium]
MSEKDIFFNHLAQTTPYANGLEIDFAKDMHIFDVEGNAYLDLVAGVSACTLGHSNQKIINAITTQANKYLHVMVYGEYIQSPQNKLAQLLAQQLPSSLNCTYFVNSGCEAIEGAMKLAKRVSGKSKIFSFKNSYHGSTHGALSIMGKEHYKSKYRPLLPECYQLNYDCIGSIQKIDNKTAAVVVEPIQGATGFKVPSTNWLKELKKRCEKVGALLIFDEIQTCFGRTGKLFALETFDVVPDILCIAKGMGGGMSIGAFISSKQNMSLLKNNPMLGHITTFGGHPLNCAASLATLEVLLKDKTLMSSVLTKEQLFRKHLVHPKIKHVSGFGLMLAIELESEKDCKAFVNSGYDFGIITFFFLFNKKSVRISPPLIISENQIIESCSIFKKILDKI